MLLVAWGGVGPAVSTPFQYAQDAGQFGAAVCPSGSGNSVGVQPDGSGTMDSEYAHSRVSNQFMLYAHRDMLDACNNILLNAPTNYIIVIAFAAQGLFAFMRNEVLVYRRFISRSRQYRVL